LFAGEASRLLSYDKHTHGFVGNDGLIILTLPLTDRWLDNVNDYLSKVINTTNSAYAAWQTEANRIIAAVKQITNENRKMFEVGKSSRKNIND
jgi:hypothetical protein